VAATGDSLIPIEQGHDAFDRAGQPKKLVEIDCGHFDVYPGGPQFETAAQAATGWFATHLG